jgi:tetratricopeptide (TPR) repeat protein
MTGPDRSVRRRRRALPVVFTGIVAVGFLSDTIANNVHLALRLRWWQTVLVIVVVVVAGAALAWIADHWESANATDDTEETADGPRRRDRGLPPPERSLAGHHDEDRAAAEYLARRYGVAVVTGVAGSGASAVGIAAAWDLVSDPARQRYVDLRESLDSPDSQRRSLIRVLRAAGIRPGAAADPGLALAKLADRLRGTGTVLVLVLDHVESTGQISWLWPDGVPGARVIACGDIKDDAGRDLADKLPVGGEPVKVRPLEVGAALELLKRQGADDRGGGPGAGPGPLGGSLLRRARALLGGTHGTLRGVARGTGTREVNTIARRVAAEPRAARELAAYLKLPGVAIAMGRWLKDNPAIPLTAVVGDLHDPRSGTGLWFILRRQLDGASPGAQRLLSLLAGGPVGALPQEAIARLAGTALERTGNHLAELSGRSLAESTAPGTYRITTQAREMASDPGLPHAPGPKAAGRARSRLVAYYARLAADHAEALTRSPAPAGSDEADGGPGDSARAQEWLRAEDTVLLQLLTGPGGQARTARRLWLIADVLDIWFTRENRPQDRRAAAEAMKAAAGAAGDAAARTIARLRLAAVARDEGDFTAAAIHLERAAELAGHRADLRLQVDTAWTAHLMTVGDLEAADNHLQRCRDRRPRRDLRGRISDLVNQAVLDLRRGGADAAHVALSQAQELADEAGDTAGQAQVHELFGIAAARTGRYRRAAEEWEMALALYEQETDATGQARCLQHRGTMTGSGAEARRLLASSLDARGDRRPGVGIALAHLYLADALDPPGGSSAIGDGAGPDHRAAGLAALAPWPHLGTEPPEVRAARARLEALPGHPVSGDGTTR